MDEVIRQRNWTEAQFLAAGFRYYARRRQLTMAARIPASHAPLKIAYALETVLADAGDVLCFDAETTPRPRLLDYDHWSVKPAVFLATYRKWDMTDWAPTPTQAQLWARGCRPYYKHAGAWARQLTTPTYVQSLESPEPALIPAGAWLLIGSEGAPWHNTDALFRERYVIDAG